MRIKKILVVDDEKCLRDLFRKKLSDEGYLVETAKDGREAVKKSRKDKFNLVLMDIRMPNMEGIEAILTIKRIRHKTVFIIITGFPLVPEVEKVLKRGGYDCIRKPFELSDAMKRIRKALKTKAEAGR